MSQFRPSRRRVMAIGVTTGTLLLTGPLALSGCTPQPDSAQPDPLERPARRAESDAALAQSVAEAHPALAEVAGGYAADRRAHAAALRTELRRVRPAPASSSPAPPPPAPPPAPADEEQARDALAGAVRAAQDEAGGLVGGLPGYRAALLASVAACCASHAVVLS